MPRGSCLCGDIAWQASGELSLMAHCHCSICRKTHGSAFSTYVSAPADGFSWLSGREKIRSYESSPGFERPFCPRCGSVVAGEPERGLVGMPAGCLDDDPGVRPLAHIFVASKAPWYEMSDALPRFDAYPPGWPSPEVARPDLAPPPAGVIRGSCVCGAVGFEITAQPDTIIDCHCSRCRKARAAAFASNIFVAPHEFRWTRGEELVTRYKVPEALRFTHCFCSRCGSTQPRVASDNVMVPAGCLDDDPGARERLHIHVDSKAPWFEISDALPRFAADPR